MPLVGFELTITVGERLQTYSLDCATIGTGPSPSVAEIMCGVHLHSTTELSWRECVIWHKAFTVTAPQGHYNCQFFHRVNDLLCVEITTSKQ
jgi:hypothetical protein